MKLWVMVNQKQKSYLVWHCSQTKSVFYCQIIIPMAGTIFPSWMVMTIFWLSRSFFSFLFFYLPFSCSIWLDTPFLSLSLSLFLFCCLFSSPFCDFNSRLGLGTKWNRGQLVCIENQHWRCPYVPRRGYSIFALECWFQYMHE